MRILIFFAILLILPVSALAIDYQGRCSVLFQVSSTLHDFDGKGSCLPFSVNEDAGVMAMSELNVAISGLDTDNVKRDKQMRKMFDVDTYPLIKGSIGPVSLGEIRKALNESDDSAVEVVFQLKIRDIEKPVTASLQNIVETEAKITADLVFTLSLADYQLKPPSVFFIIRVGDSVKVTTSFSLEAL